MSTPKSQRYHRIAYISLILTALQIIACDDDIVPPPIKYGPDWILYTTDNSQLISDTIWTITTVNASVWIGTNQGVNILDGDNWILLLDNVNSTPMLPSQRISSITVDSKGAVWFGLASKGLLYYNTRSKHDHWIYIDDPSLIHTYVYSIATDHQGDVWIGTDNGVTKFSYGHSIEIVDGSWSSYNDQNSLIPSEPIQSIGFDGYNNLIWFGTSTMGVISYNADLDWNFSMPSDVSLPILSMTFSSDRNILVGTFADWSYRYSTVTEEWTHIGDPESGGGLPSHIVNAIALEGGTIWFGTDNGLAELKNGLWSIFNIDNSPLPNNSVLCLDVDSKGNLWIGTKGGLTKYRKGGTIPE